MFTIAFMMASSAVMYYNKEELTEKFTAHSSPVDWCEANYAVHSSVAEFWNSASALLLYIPAPLGYFAYKNTKGELHEPNLYLVWMCIVISATGSVYFHSTLSVAGQVLDELPLIILAIYGISLSIPARFFPS
jgi:alkaline ceramidase